MICATAARVVGVLVLFVCPYLPWLVSSMSIVHLREQVQHSLDVHHEIQQRLGSSVEPLSLTNIQPTLWSSLTLQQAALRPSWKFTPTIPGFEGARLADYRRGFQTPGVHFKVDISNAEALQAHWQDWLDGNGVTYTGDELAHKFATFKSNLIRIQAHNSQSPPPDYLLHLGPFAANTFDEFESLYLMHENGDYNNKRGSGPEPPKPLPYPHCLVPRTACAAPREVQGTVQCQRHRVVEWCCKKGEIIYKGACSPQAFNSDPKIVQQGAHALVEMMAQTEGTRLHHMKKNVQQIMNTVEFDWEPTGVLAPIQWQSKCGSCWAFAATAAVEAAWAISKHGGHYTGDYSKPYLIDSPTKGSEQQVLDCTWRGNCGGGWPGDAYHYIRGNGLCQYNSYQDKQGGDGNHGDGAIKSEITGHYYPYTAETHSCHDGDKCGTRIHIDDYDSCIDIFSNGWLGNDATDEDYIKLCLHMNPVVIRYYVNDESGFKDLKGAGVHTYQCSGLWWTNHVMVIVGYGEKGGKKYWKIRNSWGTGWADNGYGYIRRGTDQCGVESSYHDIPIIETYSSYPTTFTGSKPPPTKPPPTKAPVCPKKPPICYYTGKCPKWQMPKGCPAVGIDA